MPDSTQTPLTVLHIVRSLEPGGMENGVVNMANLLERDGICAHVCCIQSAGRMAERMNRPERVHTLGFSNGFQPSASIAIARLARSLGAPIAHTHNLGPLIYGALALGMGGRYSIVHGEHAELAGADLLPRRMRQRRIFYKACRSIHTVSESLSRQIASLRLTSRPIIPVRNGVDLSRFSPGEPGRSVFDKDALTIGLIARFGKNKRHFELIEAFEEIADSIPAARLLMTGSGGPMEEPVRQRAANSIFRNRIRIEPFTQRPEDCYRQLSLLALPSVNEGLSNAALEAMACGVPTLSHKSCGADELLGGGGGEAADLSEPGALAQALARMLSSGPEGLARLGAQARANVEKSWSIERMAEGYTKLYRSAAPRNGKARMR